MLSFSREKILLGLAMFAAVFPIYEYSDIITNGKEWKNDDFKP